MKKKKKVRGERRTCTVWRRALRDTGGPVSACQRAPPVAWRRRSLLPSFPSSFGSLSFFRDLLARRTKSTEQQWPLTLGAATEKKKKIHAPSSYLVHCSRALLSNTRVTELGGHVQYLYRICACESRAHLLVCTEASETHSEEAHITVV